ncbi:MAG TPA: hypothetical protein VMD92_13905 [Acidobacteriaceae bacterium]|nr:hypothetical protein [Acidobacteriaceae bacterium]
MICARACLAAAFFLLLSPAALAQSSNMSVPATVTAGSAFSISTSGSGPAVLYIVGPDAAIRRSVQLGNPVAFAASDLSDAGHYVATLVANGSVDSSQFDVMPAAKPETLSFIAVPSRVPVGLHDGINGTVYVFDTYRNLITAPLPVSFALSGVSGAPQTRSVTTRDGVAWTAIDSASKQGAAKFVAQAGDASTTRVIQEVPGDPCALTISAHPDGQRITVETAPVRDCSGNPIPDGTIVTFTETYRDTQSTVDVPLKQDVARVDMPAYNGATISVASGVVAGNEIHWNGGR